MYAKGEWKFNRKHAPTAEGIKVSNDLFSSIISDNNVICLLPEPHYMPDMGDRTWYNGRVKNMKANAHLIVSAVNACIKLNPDNPQAVAESISELYEACKEGLFGLQNMNTKGDVYWESGLNIIKQAIAKVEGGK